MAKLGPSTKPVPTPRKGMPSPKLDEAEFKRRYRSQFTDPAFFTVATAIDEIADIAWRAYREQRKSPITRKAGKDLPILTTIYPSTGLRRGRAYWMRNANIRTRSASPIFS